MKDRINYIDKLKGLTIMLVVLGHFTEYSLNIKDSGFNIFYSSFHMPLFMFLSGMFSYKNLEYKGINESIYWLQKKVTRILFPFFSFAFIYSVIAYDNFHIVLDGEFGGYWFLPALFYCMIIGLIINIISNKTSNTFKYVLSISILVYGAFCLLYLQDINIRYLNNALKMFPYFLLGTWYVKYPSLKRNIENSNNIFSISLTLYFILFVLKLNNHYSLSFSPSAPFAIIIILYLVNKFDKNIPDIFSFMGRNCLEIYLLHWFFIPDMNSFGEYLMNNSTLDIFKSQFALIILVSIIFSSVIIFTCIIISTIIHKSKPISFFLSGVSHTSLKFKYIHESIINISKQKIRVFNRKSF